MDPPSCGELLSFIGRKPVKARFSAAVQGMVYPVYYITNTTTIHIPNY